VVTRTSGGRFFCRARSADDVSPVRLPTVSGRPRDSIGSRSAFSMSRLTARNGET
jgi:hypothetical protein